MKITFVAVWVSLIIALTSFSVPAHAYPAVDVHGTTVQRLTFKEVSAVWYGYRTSTGMGKFLKANYSVTGLSTDVWNKNRKEYLTYNTTLNSTGNDDLLPGFKVITYMSNVEDVNGQIAVYYNPDVKMYDVYEPGTAAF